MDTEELKSFVQSIWDNTPRNGAYVRFEEWDEELNLAGNREGLLRLAAEFLSATYGNSDPAYLFPSPPSAPVARFIKRISLEEKPPVPIPPPTFWQGLAGRVAPVGCFFLLLAGLACTLVGAITILRAIFR